MTGALFLLISAVYVSSAVPVEDPNAYSLNRTYPRFMKFPDGEGNLHDVDLEAEPDMELIEQYTRNAATNAYFLYTRRNQIIPQTLVFNNANSINSSYFNPNNPTVVIVHGYLSNRHTEPNPAIRRAFLTKGDYNVISLDWRALAFSDYVTAVRGVPAVGRGLGQFMNFLHFVTGAPYESMHLVGFSLGAHVVGNAGREMGGRAARVTGLDPAGPLWNRNSYRLNANDGVYVEAIHTDGGTSGAYGIGSAVANADFFPNGGHSQPGCLTNFCNHIRAWELFAASVTDNHLMGTECFNTIQIAWNTCRGSSFNLGNDDLRKWGSGLYRLETGRGYPYYIN